MARVSKKVYNVLRAVLVTGIVLVVGVYLLAYVLLSLPSVQNRVKSRVEVEVGKYLGTEVTVGKLDIEPFTRVAISDVRIADREGGHLLSATRVGAGIDLWPLIIEKRVVLSYAELIGVNITARRATPDAPLNAQFIIDLLKPKPGNPPKRFDVEARNVVLRGARLSYDVLSEPHRPDGTFDPNHIAIENLRADVLLPRIKNDDFAFDVKRIALTERSGLTVERLALDATLDSTHLSVRNLVIDLPRSHVAVDTFELQYPSLKTLGKDLPTLPVHLTLADGVKVTPADFAAFDRRLAAITTPLHLALDVAHDGHGSFSLDNITVEASDRSLAIDARGNLDDAGIDIERLNITADARRLLPIINNFASLKPQVSNIISRLGQTSLETTLHGTINNFDLTADATTELGKVTINGHAKDKKHFKGHISSPGVKIGELLSRADALNEIALNADFEIKGDGHKMAAHGTKFGIANASFSGHIDHIDIYGTRYDNIDADLAYNGAALEGGISAEGDNASFSIDGNFHRKGQEQALLADVNIERLKLPAGLPNRQWAASTLSGTVSADVEGNTIDDLAGKLTLTDLRLEREGKKPLALDRLHVVAQTEEDSPNSLSKHGEAKDSPNNWHSIMIDSEIASGTVEGHFTYKGLVGTVRQHLAGALPQLFTPPSFADTADDVRLALRVTPSERLYGLLNLPVTLLDAADVEASINDSEGLAHIAVNVPYLLQGKRVIEKTRLTLDADSASGFALDIATILPHKKGRIPVSVNGTLDDGHAAVTLAWTMEREHDYSGLLNLDATVERDEDGTMNGLVTVKPSHVTFNDTVWTIDPATVNITASPHTIPKDGEVKEARNKLRIAVNNLHGYHDDQYVTIDGTLSHDPDDLLCLDLGDMSLDYIFDTLAINNVDFGGRATGKFYAADVFSGAPNLYTPGLHVEHISYNDADMGNADITAQWRHNDKAVALHADIRQPNDETSVIDGAIYIGGDSLSLDFDAHKANVAFMKPFMKAFARDVQGRVSGKATLYGTFKDINLKGDIHADTLNFLLDFTNVRYSCRNEDVHIEPGLIAIDDITILDREGHTAKLGGWLRHENFHGPTFNFGVTEAQNLLCYDTTEATNHVWWGTVYGNGSAFVTGGPGTVDIKVNMTSRPGSKFTFVMSGSKEATEYKFITFRSKNHEQLALQAQQAADTVPESVKRHLALAGPQSSGPPTAFTIDLQGDITPDAQLILVMDPIGGDQIKAVGSGNMRLTYNNNDEMRIYGTYTLQRGNYNFTLQDIIVKDFIIRDGSSITFQGDPYGATIDLNAVYSTNANLRDLDQSFASDREIQRTNVPVHAVLKAQGQMSQPEIDFDLEFPTLSTDAVTKVKAIIGTDVMMNQQIIYLLALNRFYTPDYTNTESSGNELTNVASSTISSQLSSMLGKISDNWTIAPNFRSARGDFSDVEVELALSSQLLNNRLLLNGNFGYRDNTYNTQTSNFIGDFDIEYLLNARGTFRLKAYNHFNDQNYYVRNALTTQGVGVVWKNDFNNFWDLLHLRRKPKAKNNDTKPQEHSDSVRDSAADAGNTQQLLHRR